MKKYGRNKRNKRNWIESLTRDSVTAELLRTSGRRTTDDAVLFSREALNLLRAVYQELYSHVVKVER